MTGGNRGSVSEIVSKNIGAKVTDVDRMAAMPRNPRNCDAVFTSSNRHLKDLKTTLVMHPSSGNHKETSYCLYAFE